MEIKFTTYHKVQREWELLYSATKEVSPFLHPGAFPIAWHYFYPYYIKDLSRPSVAQFIENGRTVALVPLVVKGKTAQIFGAPNGFNECSMLFESEVVTAECIGVLRRHFQSLTFQKIDERNPLSKLRPNECRQTVNVAVHFGNDYEEYFKSLSSSVRQNIRTAYNRMNKDNRQMSFEVYMGGGNSLPINELINLYCLRHEGRYGVKTSILKRWFLKTQNFATRFYKYAPNALTFYLAIDGKAAAFMSGLYEADRIIVPRLSISDEFKRYSPGMIMVCEAIKYLIANTKIQILDLSQGEEAYKYKLGGTPHISYSFCF